jgi:metalloendopeptidase OMA1, mitochondrial
MLARCCRLAFLIGTLSNLLHCGGHPHEREPITVRILSTDSSGGTTSLLASNRSAKVSRDASILEPMIRVSSRVVFAAHRWGSGRLPHDWAVAVLEEENIQSLRLQGAGSITVNTGTYRLAETEAGLAALLSHELAHLLAHHDAGGTQKSTETGEPGLYSRGQESEADAIGMAVMADAGYDPGEMLRVWERLKRSSALGDELLTHLTYDRRLGELRGRLPEAFQRYVRSNRAPQRKLPIK